MKTPIPSRIEQDDASVVKPSLVKEYWQALCNRDASKDGAFWYGVLTTGVYCRPSCKSRRPKFENVRFYSSIEAAEASGLRACKRCRPRESHANDRILERMLALCRYIEAHPTERHTLSSLAKRSAMTAFHLHRVFKSYLTVTPKEYVDQVRTNALKKKLRDARSVTDAIVDSGFESQSVVYGRLHAHLGMTPKKYREGGAGIAISFAFARTPLGKVLIGATDRGICYLQFGDSEHELLAQLVEEYPSAQVAPSEQQTSAELNAWMIELNQRLEGERARRALPLDIQGTAFQKKVWDFLQSIPSGQVASYAEVAEAIGAPRAVRAAATACASNRIAVLIPCHRVIRGTGELGGYRWGLTRKRALLDRERAKRSTRVKRDSG